jgi:hypothetical protein
VDLVGTWAQPVARCMDNMPNQPVTPLHVLDELLTAFRMVEPADVARQAHDLGRLPSPGMEAVLTAVVDTLNEIKEHADACADAVLGPPTSRD